MREIRGISKIRVGFEDIVKTRLREATNQIPVRLSVRSLFFIKQWPAKLEQMTVTTLNFPAKWFSGISKSFQG